MPFILTCILTVAMFYMMLFISANKGMSNMPSARNVQSIMTMGVTVIGIFAFIFLFYTNSFLIKRRKKELGLYNILGMEKRHIARVLLMETVFVTLVSLMVGLGLGILGSKLMLLLLVKILNFPVFFGFELSLSGIRITILMFLGIFTLTYLNNIRQIHLANPVELLHGGNVGEREPKGKWILVVIGVICLGIGYYIAVTTEQVMAALGLFFVAVILVMIGTYCLFMAGSIAVLKLLRKKKSYYYTTRHFTSISGMIYRMKQNAVGLANICILSTGVLLMLSTTVSMYIGMDDIMDSRFKCEVSIRVDAGEEQLAKAQQLVDEVMAKYELEEEDAYSYECAYVAAIGKDGVFSTNDDSIYDAYSDMCSIIMVPLEDYERSTGEKMELAKGEVLLFSNYSQEYGRKSITIDDQEYKVKKELDEIFFYKEKSALPTMPEYILVTGDKANMEKLRRYQNYIDISTYLEFNVKGDSKQFIPMEEELNSRMPEAMINDGSYSFDGKEMNRQDFLSTYGGLLFLGIFLGALFLMATALIIYYKQVSEGYDDRQRFEIMQKVGMSKKEVHQSIRSQVLTVFFLPLVMAIVHILFAFKLITRLLGMMNMVNIPLFALCTAVTILIFGLVYALIYVLTARVYYKIVN